MKKEKELLLKDVCGRLPYNVKLLHIPTNVTIGLQMIGNDVIEGDIHDLIGNFKPYLFPLSSMAVEQKIECFKGTDIELDECNEIWSTFPISISDIAITNLYNWLKVIDWLNRNHFDYRGLIKKGLAIDATGLNVYKEESK